MHISQKVESLLTAGGWERGVSRFVFKKMFATGGQFGRQIKTLQIDVTGRWLERVDGWGKVESCVDLRDFPNDPAGAIERVLK